MADWVEESFRNYTRTPLGWIDFVGHLYNSRGIWDVDYRTLPHFAFTLTVAGKVRWRDVRGISQVVGPGTLALLFPGVPHSYKPDPGERWDEMFAFFDGPLFQTLLETGALDPAMPVLQLGNVEYWHGRFKSALNHLCAPGHIETFHDVSLLAEVLCEALTAARPGMRHDAAREWLDNARRLLCNFETGEPWHGLEHAAERMGESYETFRRRFVQLSGMSPGRFRAAKLMQHASNLLQDRTKSIKEIAAQCGFASAGEFSRQFRRVTGLPPHTIRRK